MTRLLGPDPSAQNALGIDRRYAGRYMTVYTDQACTQLADIRTYNAGDPTTVGAAIPGSRVTLDRESRPPKFWYPDSVDMLWGVVIRSGPTVQLPADSDYRFDALDSTAPYFDVRRYGAKCDGVTDDTAAVQAAINACPAGGVVYFPQGITLVTGGLTCPGNRTLLGAGNYNGSGFTPASSGGTGSIIKVKNGANPDYVIASSAYLTTGAGNFFNIALTIRNLFIDGNKANQTAGRNNGLVLACGRSLIDNVRISNMAGCGIVIYGQQADGNALGGVGFENRVINSTVEGCHGYGFLVPGTSSNLSDGWFINNTVAFNDLGGVRVDYAYGWNITGNHVYGSCTDGIVTQLSYATTINDNYVEGFGTAGYTWNGMTWVSTPLAWSGATTYRYWDLVIASDGNLYYSAADGNVNHDPTASPSFWTRAIGNAAFYGIAAFALAGPRRTTIADNIVSPGHNSITPVASIAYRCYFVQGLTATTTYVHMHDNQALVDYQVPVTAVAYRLNAAGSGVVHMTGSGNSYMGTFSSPWSVDAGIVTSGVAATVAAGAQATTAAAGAEGAYERAGSLTATTVGSPAAGALATVTFGQARFRTPPAITVTPRSAAAASAGLYVSAKSTTAFTVSCASTPAASTALLFDYRISDELQA